MRLWKRHKCDGTETGRRFTPPGSFSLPAMKGRGWEFADRMTALVADHAYGFTIITYRCECGNVWTKKVTGEAV